MPFRRLLSRLSFLKSWFFNPTALTAATIAVAAALFALSPAILSDIELNWLDLRFRARGPIAPRPAVVLAAIDEKSLALPTRAT